MLGGQSMGGSMQGGQMHGSGTNSSLMMDMPMEMMENRMGMMQLMMGHHGSVMHKGAH